MLKTQENFISMLTVVGSVFDNFKTVWNTNSVFTKYVTDFTANRLLIDVAAQGGNIITTGASQDKSNAAHEAFDFGSKLSKRASIFALEQNNSEMHDMMRVSKGSLSQLADTKASAKLHELHDRMMAAGDDLLPYVSAEELTRFKALIDTYDKLMSRPRELTVNRKTHNEDLPELIQDSRKLLYKLDSLVNMFDGTEFEAAYLNARRIVNSGTRKAPVTEETPSAN
ncbi:MAG: hypothetical protein H6Q19_2243 [Bacteroidetes bacterium]|nr:hypothetical protein [Bacteroidota bacterium]